jgi:hypothetical protein
LTCRISAALVFLSRGYHVPSADSGDDSQAERTIADVPCLSVVAVNRCICHQHATPVPAADDADFARVEDEQTAAATKAQAIPWFLSASRVCSSGVYAVFDYLDQVRLVRGRCKRQTDILLNVTTLAAQKVYVVTSLLSV